MTKQADQPEVAYTEQGLFQRYATERTDGKPLDPGELSFTLRFDKDSPWCAAARAALRNFCERVTEIGYIDLAVELNQRLDAVEQRLQEERDAQDDARETDTSPSVV